MKNAFTLAEMMVVLVIIGVVAAITIPQLNKNMGDNNKILFKSTYKLVETAVNELASDIALYPAGELVNTLENNRFSNDFSNKLNTIGVVNNLIVSNYATRTPNFVTSNGMAWYGFNLVNNFYQDPANIWIDIDGKDKGKNILHDDVMEILVYKSGKVGVIGTNEINYLTN
jgi:prepilin-type N-terminal cleavage/methylation domain-containing protein